ncbi:hypothetical protein OIN60_01250 [Paenibacillus sp. P96]|uniref:Uncharacterized protein n=1 Tax=Paenibacillus zeirhizosphaerae TaxID=2987519 RepID=A0ABT9FL10_9BACL|nr:hypothetical protein [Paenibacillus sp. P96]MDP4095418.1 hypothetical protein [Paenibacillus sp. P96]
MNTPGRKRPEKIYVELTFDEALALTGVRYPANQQIGTSARQKIRAACEKTFDLSPENKVDYELLT